MTKKSGEKSAFRAGMYLLETLTAGMYNEPLSIYREYIQNAVDSIDLAWAKRRSGSLRVTVSLDPAKRRISIRDNGLGIPARKAEETLSSMGISGKPSFGMRGFRGIGRLGGVAFCERATYRTKARGEKIDSVQVWNCEDLRRLLSDSPKSSMNLQEIFSRVTTFYKENSKRANDSYFEVVLDGVSSFRGHNMDIQKVRNYLSQVAPAPFHPAEFTYGKEIGEYLSRKLSRYGKYEIILNGEPVYKPYQDKVKITKAGYDRIEGIEFFEINVRDKAVACGWYGQRRELLGAITKGEALSGIRIRVGDILLGDGHLLDGCFREARFNSYMIGEIHVDCPELIPNSRRDDFVDNEMKTLFYNEVERAIGLPISKEIRLQSRLRTVAGSKNSRKGGDATGSHSGGRELSGLSDHAGNHRSSCQADLISRIPEECRRCSTVSKLLALLGSNHAT